MTIKRMARMAMSDDVDASLSRFMRLKEAAELFGFSATELRSEAKRGRLAVYKVAGRLWTSEGDVARMFELCRVEPALGTAIVRPESESEASLLRRARVLLGKPLKARKK